MLQFTTDEEPIVAVASSIYEKRMGLIVWKKILREI